MPTTALDSTRRIAISRLQQEFQRIVDANYASLWSYVNVLTGGSSDSDELTDALQRCLNQLAPAARRFVTARYEQGLPIHQIAHQESLNVTTARVRLFRIRDTLRTCLESYLAGGVIS